MGKNALKVSNTDLADAIRDRVAGIVQNCKDDGENDVELYNRIYGDRDIQDGSKKNKICQLRQGKTVTLDDIAALADFTQLPIEYILTGKQLDTNNSNSTKNEPTTKSFLESVNALFNSRAVKKISINKGHSDNAKTINRFSISVEFEKTMDARLGFIVQKELINGLIAIESTFSLPPHVRRKTWEMLEDTFLPVPLFSLDENKPGEHFSILLRKSEKE